MLMMAFNGKIYNMLICNQKQVKKVDMVEFADPFEEDYDEHEIISMEGENQTPKINDA